MGLIRRLAEERDRHITQRAQDYFDDGEEIIQWVRVREPTGRHDGFIYLTEQRCVVHWGGRADGRSRSILWEEITAWGLNRRPDDGPLLGIETENDVTYAQLRVATTGMASEVSTFLRRFSELAPETRKRMRSDAGLGTFDRPDGSDVPKAKKSLASHSRRVFVTVLGILLISAGILLSLPLVPGPGFLVILAGLAVLASDYDWAKDALDWAKERYRNTKKRLTSKSSD